MTQTNRPRLWYRGASTLGVWSILATQIYAAVPRSINFGITVGPDGPWNAIVQSVSWPEQNVSLLPSLTKSNLIISEAACSGQDNYCPIPQTNLWSGILGDWSWMNSTPFDGSSWDTSVEPLNLTGQATLISDRVTLHESGQSNAYLDFIADTIDHSYKVNYPSPDTSYSMGTGFFSLYGASSHINYTSVNGSFVSLNTTLASAYKQNIIPSVSYSLHAGSGSLTVPVSGSLVLGGYDRSRCLTQPIVSSNGTFDLTDIGIGVAEGGSPFSSSQSVPLNGLLQRNGNTVNQLNVLPNPGVPYLYLPADTCLAIAQILPIRFDEDLGLYLWNISDPTFEDIMSSPSYLSFTFEQSTRDTTTIYVPFALLNLTLENPLVSTKTQYFPCSPYKPSDGTTYHLGRSFLQAAYLAQNWQTGRSMLAQAPGPDGVDGESIVEIYSKDTLISPMVNAPLWNATWSSELKALPLTTNEIAASTSSRLSGDATVGIVIGILAPCAIVIVALVFWRRRKAATVNAAPKKSDLVRGPATFHPPVKPHEMIDPWAITRYEMGQQPVEMEGTQVREIDGTSIHEKRTK